MAIGKKTLERLSVELTADDRELRSVLGNATKSLSGIGSKLRTFGAALAPVAGAFAAVGGAAVAVSLKAGRMADELLDLSDMTGLTTDQLQEFRRVTNQAGVDTDVLAEAAKKMTVRMATGAEGSADLRQGLKSLGISARDAEGNLRPMSEVMDESIVALAGMADEATRNVTATKLFGRSAAELAPVLGLGADEIERLRGEAHDLGLVIGGDALENANRFRQTWDGLQQELGGVVARVGVDLIPTMQTLADKVSGSWRPAIEKVADSFVFVVEAAVGFGDNLKKIWIGIQGITLHAVQGIIGAVAELGARIPIIGDKIAVLGDRFDAWANTSMANLRDQMDALGASTAATTATIRDQTAAAGENAVAMTRSAAAVAKAAGFEEIALLNLENTLEGLRIAHQDLEMVAVGTAQNINIKASGAFTEMADAVRRNANAVLGAVQRVLQRLSGGGGILGGIVGGITGFLSGGPIGAGLGFAGGVGLFAEGGRIAAGDIGIVGERGPEVITGPANVTPIVERSGPTDAQISRLIAAAPRGQTPSEIAANTWWRQVFSELVLDGRARGVL